MLKRYTYIFHHLWPIAMLMWIVLIVTRQKKYDMVYFLCQLGAFKMQRSKELMWKLCIPVWITLLSLVTLHH
jgi:hypothetical protein